MAWTPPTYDEFKAFFDRDFNFAPEKDPTNKKYVRESDFDKASVEALTNFNRGLFGADAQVTAVFMYLVAWALVYNIQNSTKGLSSQSRFPISANSAGGVNVSYSVPEKYLKDPYIAQLAMNGYGLKYLSVALPMTTGNVKWMPGTTTWT